MLQIKLNDNKLDKSRAMTNCSKLRYLDMGANVWVRILLPGGGDKWVLGVVLQAHGNVSYSVKLEGGHVRKYLID